MSLGRCHRHRPTRWHRLTAASPRRCLRSRRSMPLCRLEHQLAVAETLDSDCQQSSRPPGVTMPVDEWLPYRAAYFDRQAVSGSHRDQLANPGACRRRGQQDSEGDVPWRSQPNNVLSALPHCCRRGAHARRRTSRCRRLLPAANSEQRWHRFRGRAFVSERHP